MESNHYIINNIFERVVADVNEVLSAPHEFNVRLKLNYDAHKIISFRYGVFKAMEIEILGENYGQTEVTVRRYLLGNETLAGDGQIPRDTEQLCREAAQGAQRIEAELLEALGVNSEEGPPSLSDMPPIEDGVRKEYDALFDWYYRQAEIRTIRELSKYTTVGYSRLSKMHSEYVTQYGEGPIPK